MFYITILYTKVLEFAHICWVEGVMDGDAHPTAALCPCPVSSGPVSLGPQTYRLQLPCFLFLTGLTVEARKISAVLTFMGFKKTNYSILKHHKASYPSWPFLGHPSQYLYPWFARLVSPWALWRRLRSLPFSELSKSKEGFCYPCKPYSA